MPVVFPSSPLLYLALILGVIVVARNMPAPVGARVRGLPALAALGAMAMTVYVWGGLRAPAVVDDEAAYLLQAELFAHGTWSAPAAPVPYAFTQPAVLVTPVTAPKMAPGHAVVLAPGVALGLPGLMPVLSVGAAAALLVVLARRSGGAAVALLAVTLWLTQAGQFRWRASYFSESTTTVLTLAGWLLLDEWLRSRRGWMLTVYALTIGWMAVTRPLTALALAIPAGVLVLKLVVQRRAWKQLVVAMVTGAVILGALPVQNTMVLGDWRRSPLALYGKQYMPFDRIGFGADTTPAALSLTPTLAKVSNGFTRMHAQYTPDAVGATFLERIKRLATSNFSKWRVLEVPALVIGLCVMGGAGWFALASLISLYTAYLLYAHEPAWTVYYLEVTPVPAFIIALGAWRALTAVAGARANRVVLACGIGIATLIVAARDVSYARDFRAEGQEPYRRFARAVAPLSGTRAIVFVRYASAHNPHDNLVRNVADPVNDQLITALDLGATRNRAIASAFPGRAAFVWDEATNTLLPAD